MGCGCAPGCDCGCGGGGPSHGADGDRLNNPSIEQPGDEAQVLIIMDGSGGPSTEKLQALMQMLVGLGNGADEAGLTDNATEMDQLLGKMAKVAQYEGFVNYWLANGRAFELAWKKKREKSKPDDARPNEYKSAHDAWMEVLDEYQESLLSNQGDFLSKYAKKEVEKSDCGSPSATMSKSMTEWSKKMKDKAEKEGKTLGEAYSEWLDSQKMAGADKILMEKIANRITEGSAPGVAVYEALYELTTPARLAEVSNDLKAASERLVAAAKAAGKEDLAKEAQMLQGFWDALTNPFKGWLGQTWHKTKDWFQDMAASGGQSFKLMRSIQRKLPIVVHELEQLERAVGTSAVSPVAFQNAISAIMPDLKAYHAMVSPMVAMPPIPDPASPRYQSRVTGGVDAKGYEMLIADLKQVLNAVNKNNSLAYEKGKATQSPSPSMKPQNPPEDVRLQKEFEGLLDALNNTVGQTIIDPKAFSKAVGVRIPKMVDEAVDQVREPTDFVDYAAKIRDVVIDMIQRQITRSGIMTKINPHSRTMMSKFYETMKSNILRSVEQVLRTRYERKYQHRSMQPQQVTR